MERKEYNGWTNYETWCVALWLDNEPGTHYETNEICEREEIETGEAAEALKEWVEEMRPELGASMFSDLLGAALSEVNWQEIAEAHAPEKEDEAEEEAAQS